MRKRTAKPKRFLRGVFKNLAKTAGFVFWDKDEHWANGDQIDWASSYNEEIAKFGEAIVRECAGVDFSEAQLNEEQKRIVKSSILKHFKLKAGDGEN